VRSNQHWRSKKVLPVPVAPNKVLEALPHHRTPLVRAGGGEGLVAFSVRRSALKIESGHARGE